MRLRIVVVLPLAALVCGASARAQSAASTVPAPLSLVTAPPDPLAYAAMRQRSRELYDKREYAAAEPLLLQLTREYPRDGENWAYLGGVERRLGKFAEAAAAHARATAILGWDYPSYTEFSEAASHLAAGDKPRALAVLRRLVFEHRSLMRASLYNQPLLAALKGDPEFLRLVGRPDTSGWTRTQGWRYDIDHVYEEVKRVSPDLRDSLPPEFVRRYQALKRDVPTLSDEQLWIGINRMLAALRASGHTGLWGHPPFSIQQLPLQLWVFPEGIFVIDADREHEALVGSRLVSIGGVAAETAVQRIGELVSVDGDMDYLRWPILLLGELQVLHALGIVPSVDSATLTLESPKGGRRDVRLGTSHADRQSILLPPHGVAPQLFLKDLAKRHWEMPMPDHDAQYVRLLEVRDDSAETLAAFGLRLRTVLAASHPANLIFDVRGNRGGSTALYTELLRTLVAFSAGEGHRLYILIDRNSYSATGNLITELERLANPVFVGEPSGQCCNLHGDATFVRLPYSGIEGGISAVRWNLSHPWDRRTEMVPQVPVQLSAKDYFAGRDPALEAVFALIHSSK